MSDEFDELEDGQGEETVITDDDIVIQKDEGELYVVTNKEYRVKKNRQKVEKTVYKVYTIAIKEAVMEYLKKYGYLKTNEQITNYYIEYDRNNELMMIVIEQG